MTDANDPRIRRNHRDEWAKTDRAERIVLFVVAVAAVIWLATVGIIVAVVAR